jgi:hypothetical protein
VEGDRLIRHGHFAIPVELFTHMSSNPELRQLCIEDAFLTAIRWRAGHRRLMIHLVRSRGTSRC